MAKLKRGLMKLKSLKAKFILILLLIVISIVFIFLTLGNFFLEPYYMNKEKSGLVSMYDSIKNLEADENATLEISKIAANTGTTIMISDKYFREVYSSTNIFGRANLPEKVILKFFYDRLKISNDNSYVIEIIVDPFGSQRLIMAGKLSDEHTLFLSKPIESIKNSISIYNDFLILASLMVLFFGVIVMFFVGTKFTKPIYELVDISKRIANLDFSKKYIPKGSDEINMLGQGINTMSDKLSENILKLSQANSDLQNDLSQKERTEVMRKDFLQNASHELKTPISVISSYSEMLMDKIITDPEDLDYYYNVIHDETEKMSKIVRNLLGLAQLESQNRGLNLELFDISELLCDILSSYSIIFEKNNISLKTEIQDNLIASVDKFLIERVLTNYITNAIDHSDDKKEIKVSLRQEGKIVYFGVYNSTNAELDNEKIWASFYKGANSTGTGLGLSIVKAIMEAHNREYGFYKVDDGIEFYIKI
jgi:signal transduction histidine kinase